ncbi:MAG: hypothetical protein M9900_06685 [Flavobacteriales bacterium]|nr:hypothetical protein [Flavobacteriales bacterium]
MSNPRLPSHRTASTLRHAPPAAMGRRTTWAAALLLVAALPAAAQNIAINSTGAAADPKALLDISSVSKGLLIPRMADFQRNAIPALTPANDGLVVFQTNGAIGTRGFYVLHGGTWRPLNDGGKNGWDVFGNNLFNAAYPNPDYLGTNDNRPLLLRTNNLQRMRVDASGFMAVGNTSTAAANQALEQLDINGALGVYYEPPLGYEASNTDAAGVFRYQAYGTNTGSAPYRRGTLEKPATNPNNAATIGDVLGSANTYPLQYAGHWGNITGEPMRQGYVVATVPPTIYQPKLGGWRAFENPYNEVVYKPWTHFKEAVCTPGTAASIIPSGPTISIGDRWSDDASLPPGEGELISPYQRYVVSQTFVHHQYLYFAEELNAELAQVAGNTSVTGGLCPGGQIDSIGFRVSSQNWTRGITTGEADIIVRNAPDGLVELNGFDISPGDPATMGCGTIPDLAGLADWPDNVSIHWQMIRLNPPFIWDGRSNVIVDVAVRHPNNSVTPSTAGTAARVRVTQLPVNASFCAHTQTNITGGTNPLQLFPDPSPAPGWACPAVLSNNKAVRMPDLMSIPNYIAGVSKWRPMARFAGKVTTVTNTGTVGTDGNYITYPGALVLEDSTGLGATGVPWGRWRPAWPSIYNTGFSYKGKGTISAQRGVYDNTVRLNDHVLDRYFDGRVAPADAARFGGTRLLSIGEMDRFARQHRHLPTMQGRTDWERGNGFSLGQITNQLWVTAETHALYLGQLHNKLNAIEVLTNDRLLNTGEYRQACREIAGMAPYTDAEKTRLMEALRKRTPQAPPNPGKGKTAPRHGH